MDPSAAATTSAAEAAQNPSPNPDADPPEGADFALATAHEGPGGLGDSEGSAELGADRKRVVPEEIAKGVVFLECESSAEGGSCDVYLVGTAHVSQESCEEVQAVIRYLKPQVVFLELCSSRVAILTPQNLHVPTLNEMIDTWKKKKSNTFGILYSWFLAKVASKLEVLPGSEFRVAYEEAMSYGAKVILGDRPVQITLRRSWGKMTLWYRAKFLYYILFQTIFLPSPEDLNKMLKEMNDVDMLTRVIQEMSKAFPTLMETLLHERDMYMSSKLLKVANNHSSVVAVVGKGHLSGIKKHWKQPIEGCDGSILLDSDGHNVAEKNAPPNLTLRTFDVIDDIKAELEKECGGVVSCADVLALATRDGVKLSGGAAYALPTGRRDGVVSNVADVHLPSPMISVAEAVAAFLSINLDIVDLTTLLGAHSIGLCHCGFFMDRLYNDKGTGLPDPSIDPTLCSPLY